MMENIFSKEFYLWEWNWNLQILIPLLKTSNRKDWKYIAVYFPDD